MRKCAVSPSATCPQSPEPSLGNPPWGPTLSPSISSLRSQVPGSPMALPHQASRGGDPQGSTQPGLGPQQQAPLATPLSCQEQSDWVGVGWGCWDPGSWQLLGWGPGTWPWAWLGGAREGPAVERISWASAGGHLGTLPGSLEGGHPCPCTRMAHPEPRPGHSPAG